MGWFLTPLRRYADFTGRARRTDYWMFVLFVGLGAVLLRFVDESLGATYADAGVEGGIPFVAGSGVLGSIYSLFLLVPTFAIGARRLHDIGVSGWLQLIAIIPVLGIIALLVLWVVNGTPGPNRHGPDPKTPAGPEDVDRG
ncbi:uncharacterized membrane protein YhaH (DUF805 family) [Pseudonocardia sediminis]|uniref:Uncharacterized membrane protein YhaH (DUF805 family) n=1 Tax=Pseudonocardia sediminis TaxID=1397368 RepID=A0A4Q7UXR5_PSEST|nr:DUF805 domain-containing protein [Pseudonocardia sediminis]RZT85848.1 uncharacterized membrane protein YhaH (DUF805 family) [Pseudonocardia sediminis]